MYGGSDFEYLFIRYKAESMPQGESIQTFCIKSKVSYNLFYKWYKDINRFYYLRKSHDMRCKYDRVLLIIHEQFHREPMYDEAFIVMSKDRRKVRLSS